VTKNLTDDVKWSSEQQIRSTDERRSGIERRQYKGPSITVPDMRAGHNRRTGDERRDKLRLTITGRAIDV